MSHHSIDSRGNPAPGGGSAFTAGGKEVAAMRRKPRVRAMLFCFFICGLIKGTFILFIKRDPSEFGCFIGFMGTAGHPQ
jgi:hypothetical protein